MALDRLAPDQRAVVQLVLQQERSYDELAELLGIPADAVRERARRGLERLDAGEGLGEGDRARITDYLLGQQSVSGREATRRLLGEDAEARAWAQAVAGDLSAVARSPLPEIPDAGSGAAGVSAAAPVAPERRAGEPAPANAEPTAEQAAAAQAGVGEPVAGPATGGADPATARPLRGRPRPGRPAGRPAPGRPPGSDRDRPRSSLLGGALLLGGVGLVVAAIVIWLLFGSGDDNERDGDAAATPTATAEATPEAAAQIPLEAPGDGEATGQMTLFVSQEGQIAFTIEGSDVPPPGEGEAYAMWLTGGDEPRRLGFITDEDPQDGNIGVSGPQESDAEKFPGWFAEARRVLVTRETSQDARKPGPVVLRGTIQGGGQGG